MSERPARAFWKRRSILVASAFVAVVLTVCGGMEFLRRREANFDAGVKASGGNVHRVRKPPGWLKIDYIRPLAKWLEPALPCEVQIVARKVDRTWLHELSSVRGLVHLMLDHPAIALEDLNLLASHSDLRSLGLSGRHFTDACVNALPSLPKLQNLTFEDCPLTEAVLPSLHRYASRLDDRPLRVEMESASLKLATDVSVAIPAETEFGTTASFSIQIGVSRRTVKLQRATLLVTTQNKARSAVHVDEFQVQADDAGKIAFEREFDFGPVGECNWFVSLADVPYGDLNLSFTLAEGKITVKPAPQSGDRR